MAKLPDAGHVGLTLLLVTPFRSCACVQARIKSAGGRIVFSSGSHRVMGMLAMSRAIGDHFLRPYVIAEPEVRFGFQHAPSQTCGMGVQCGA